MKIKILIIFCLFHHFIFCEEHFFYSDFDRFQKCFTKEEIQNRLEKYLIKDNEINDHFLLTNQAFYLYESLQKKQMNQPEYILYLTDELNIPQIVSPLPDSLTGLKIAIDPGHFGGKFAFLEQRVIQLPAEDSVPFIQFDEGTLNVLTAKILKRLLEKSGSHVLLTKDKTGQGVYPQDFFEWLKEFKADSSLSLSDIFRTSYNSLDLLARVNKINHFHPDLTIIIHYNAHQDPLLKECKTTDQNFNLVFVGGSFNKKELENYRSRYKFLRLLLTFDFSNSVLLSGEILDQFVKHLHIPSVKDEDEINYLLKNSIKIKEGVYARNLEPVFMI